MSCLHWLLCRLLPHQHCGMFRPPLGTCGGKPSRELWPRPSTTMMSGRGLNFSCCPKACSVPLAVAAANTSGQPRLSRWTGFSGGMKGSAGRCGSLALSPPRSAAAPPTLTDRSWPLGLPGKVLTAKPVRLCFRKACAQPQQRPEMHCKLCTLRVPPRPLRPSTTFLWPLRLKPRWWPLPCVLFPLPRHLGAAGSVFSTSVKPCQLGLAMGSLTSWWLWSTC